LKLLARLTHILPFFIPCIQAYEMGVTLLHYCKYFVFMNLFRFDGFSFESIYNITEVTG
jgi:hypothetical protein